MTSLVPDDCGFYPDIDVLSTVRREDGKRLLITTSV
jgi:hypothetical protein